MHLFLTGVFAQKLGEWVHPPVKHPVRLAGTFGELRNNHFHTGIDIKSSNGKIGDPLYAVEDGWISRIRVSAGSYGQVLYIDHPNGFTTVYAHMHSFRKDIADFVKQMQYDNRTFEIDSSFSQALFHVKKGEQIGVMGTTGRSYGPHLHFEIRDTKTEVPINPLHFNWDIPDNIAPKVNYLLIHTLDDKHQKLNTDRINLIKKGNVYTPQSGTLRIPAWRVGLAAYVRDLMTGVSNNNGIYSAELKVDGKTRFKYKMDSISFDDFRYLNGHIDFDHYVRNKNRAHQLYRHPGNLLPIYEDSIGVFKLYSQKPRMVELNFGDYHGNESIISFKVLRDTIMKEYQGKVFQYYLPYHEQNIVKREDLVISFPKGSLYKDLFLSVDQLNEKESNYASSVYHIGNEHEAVHGYFDLYFRTPKIDSNLIEKLCIVHCDKNKYTSYGGQQKDLFTGTKVAQFGSYVLLIDTIPPKIQAESVPIEVREGSRIQFIISDNLQVKGSANDLRYEAFLDDQWILFEYDLKNKRLTHRVNEEWMTGNHQLLLRVWDDRNNKQEFRKSIKKR